eukprot:SAG11_NODE_26579_length_343_cov_1.040984_1_plen_56_part_10
MRQDKLQKYQSTSGHNTVRRVSCVYAPPRTQLPPPQSLSVAQSGTHALQLTGQLAV